MRQKLFIVLLFLSGIASISAQTTDSIKIMTYNLLQYGITTGPNCTPNTVANKNTWLNLIMGSTKPDLLAVNELRWNTNNAYALNLKSGALGYNTAMQITAAGNQAGSDIGNMLFYNSNKFGYLHHEAILGNVRDIDVYQLYHKAATQPGDTLMLWAIVAHLKAGNAANDAVQRGEAAKDIMTWLNAHPNITNYMVMGDFNLYSGTEAAYVNFLKASDPMHFIDPTGVTTGWQGQSYAALHTQCPVTTTSFCFSGGGLDDRFDYILMSPAVIGGTSKIQYVPGSYNAFGNTGNSYNTTLNCSAVGTTVCSALLQNSDHIPVVAKLAISIPSAIANTLNNQLEINILDNPIEDNLQLQCIFHQKANYQLEIVNVLGQVMHKTGINSMQSDYTFSATNWQSGVYFLRVYDENGRSLVKKVMKR